MSEGSDPGYFMLRRMRSARPGSGAVAASVAMHLLVVGALAINVIKRPDALPEYKVYRVDIYSPPPQEEGEPAAPETKPAIVKPPEEKKVAIEKKPAPAPTKKAVSPAPGTSKVAKGRNPDPKSLVSGEGLDVHIEGDEFPYPEYLNNIITQLNRYFRWTGAPNLEVRVGFEIMRDGTVREIRILDKSGNINFDIEAISAVEQAGKRGAFGPLPKGWVPNRLPIAFTFQPPGR